jgi:hypothetical protein
MRDSATILNFIELLLLAYRVSVLEPMSCLRALPERRGVLELTNEATL